MCTLLIGVAPGTDAQYPLGARGAIALTIVVTALAFLGFARSGLIVADDGLYVRNYFEVTYYEWAIIDHAALGRGRAGALLLVSGENVRVDGLSTSSFRGVESIKRDAQVLSTLNALIETHHGVDGSSAPHAPP